MKEITSRLLLVCGLATVLAGCQAGWHAMVGKSNAEAMDLIIDCKQDQAMAKLESSGQSGAARKRRLSLALQAGMHIEAGDKQKAEQLYPRIRADSDDPKPSIAQIRKDAMDMAEGFQKERKKRTGKSSC